MAPYHEDGGDQWKRGANNFLQIRSILIELFPGPQRQPDGQVQVATGGLLAAHVEKVGELFGHIRTVSSIR